MAAIIRKSKVAANPEELPGGEYMNSAQVEWFRKKLELQLMECETALENIRSMEDFTSPGSDEADIAAFKVQAAQQGEADMRLNARRREILAALARIGSGDYGYCEDTGDDIGLARLKANPSARLTVEAQQRREHHGRFGGRGTAYAAC